ncbi:MAG: RNA methyltransferase [Bacteroidales bacterium]|nr:RNA methyltransferase [Bacteroidales bacterium]
MISKNRISEIRKLHLRKYRDESRLFLVEGRKSVEMLLRSDLQVVDLYATERFMEEHAILLTGVPATEVSTADMERISTLSTPPELLAVVRQPVECMMPDDMPLVALDRIADPGNFGTIARTANWFGIHHIVCSPDTVEFCNPKCIQATMGSFCDVQVLRTDLVSFLESRKAPRRVVGTFLDGESVDTFAFRPDDIVVIGNESAGISPQVAQCVTHRITIPRGEGSGSSAESLNAAVAAAIVMQQWRRG